MTHLPASSRRWMELGVRAVLLVVVVMAFPGNFVSDVRYYWLHAQGLSLGHLPYRDFLWEYPPLAAVPLLLVPLAAGAYPTFLVLFAASMAGAEYACLVVLRRAWPDHAAAVTRWWHLLVLPLATIAWFRLDFVAVLPAVVALAGLVRRRPAAGAVVAGIAAKLWPGIFVVAFVARRQWRQVVLSIAGSAAVAAAWFAWSPSGVADFLRFRRGSGLQAESTVGAVLRLAGHRPAYVSGAWVVDQGHFGWVEPLLLGSVGLAALTLALGAGRLRVRPDAMPELLGALVLAVLLASRLLSPQFLVWAAPFVVVVTAARGAGREGALFVVAVALTLWTQWTYRAFILGSSWRAAPVVARNGILLVVAGLLLARAVAWRGAGEGDDTGEGDGAVEGDGAGEGDDPASGDKGDDAAGGRPALEGAHP